MLASAARDGFDVLLTMDSGVPYQQHLATLPLAVMVIVAPSNDLVDLYPLIPRIQQALDHLTPRSIVRIE